jgi:hypothetical protein
MKFDSFTRFFNKILMAHPEAIGRGAKLHN